jgi:hypothetical protein
MWKLIRRLLGSELRQHVPNSIEDVLASSRRKGRPEVTSDPVAVQKVGQTADLFLRAVFHYDAHEIRVPARRHAVCAYIGGVLDSLTANGPVNDRDCIKLWTAMVIRHLELPPEAAEELVAWSLWNQHEFRDWTNVGGRAVREFLSSGPSESHRTLLDLVRTGRTQSLR